MANGDELSIEEFREKIKPIEAIRGAVERCAKVAGLDAIFYSRGWPHVVLRWVNNCGLDCLVQLYLAPDTETFILWAAAHKDLSEGRYFKKVELQIGLQPPFEEQFILAQIQTGLNLCNSWKLEDLSDPR